MDAPNAPNPANPNALDQFVDAVQGPTNEAQGPAVQNQAQGPAVQNQAQGPADKNQAQVPVVQNQAQGPEVQIPVQGPAQIGQNVPIQPLQQLAQVQLVPAGIVVPTP